MFFFLFHQNSSLLNRGKQIGHMSDFNFLIYYYYYYYYFIVLENSSVVLRNTLFF